MFNLAMSKQAGTVAAAMAAMLLSATANAAPKDATGVWLTEDARARIQTETCGPGRENLCGYVVWMKAGTLEDGKPRVDDKNPEAPKATRPLLGHQLIMGLKPNEEGRYEGQIYNSDDGKKYDVTVWLDKPGVLKVKGCLVAFLCSTQTWTKTTDALPGQLVGAAGSPGGPRADREWATSASAAAPQPASSVKRDPKPRS